MPLGYLSLYLSVLAFVPHTRLALVAAAVGAVLALMLWGFSRGKRGRALIPYIVGFAILGTTLAPFGAAWGIFPTLGAALAGAMAPRRSAILAALTLAALVVLTGMLLGRSPVEWAPPLMFGFMAWLTAIYRTSLEDANAALALAQEEVRRLGAQAERQRIARDLHDLLGHTLTLVTIKADLARRLLDKDPELARRELGELSTATRNALAEVRNAVTGMRGATLDEAVAAAGSALRSAGIRLTVDLQAIGLPATVQNVLSMVAREATTNVLRHSGADACTMTLSFTQEGAVFVVTDNGHGGPITEGSGIAGMRDRLVAVGGTLSLATTGDGTTLQAAIPLETTT